MAYVLYCIILFLVYSDVSNNAIVWLPSNAFVNLTFLHTLILSYNQLRCVQRDTFAGLNHLRVL